MKLVHKSKVSFSFKVLREEEKMRKRINTKLPKAVEEIRNTLGQLRGQGKEFKILGMTFEELNEYQETEHDRQVQEERDLKKQEKMKTVSQEMIYGVKKTTSLQGNKSVRSENKTLKPQVKRLQHSSLKVNFGAQIVLFPRLRLKLAAQIHTLVH